MTDANRVSADEIKMNPVGRRVIFERNATTRGSLRLATIWRADRSSCGTREFRNRMRDFAPRSQDSTAGGSRDVAPWRISDPLVCIPENFELQRAPHRRHRHAA